MKVSKVKADYIPTLLDNGKLIGNISAIAKTITFLLMWVPLKAYTRIYPMRATVLLLFSREISLTQCFFLLSLHMRLNPTYLQWTVRNLLLRYYSMPIPLLKILKVYIAPILSCLINESLLCGIFPEKR